jgi:hypothetical protein
VSRNEVAGTDTRVLGTSLRANPRPVDGWAAAGERSNGYGGGQVGASYILGAAVLADVGSPVLLLAWASAFAQLFLALGSASLVKPRRRVETPLASSPPTWMTPSRFLLQSPLERLLAQL